MGKKGLVKGEVVNDTYEILLRIGEGAFGEVYRVRHKYLGIQVLKVLKDEYVKNTDIETVTREAKILSGLTHPNIVRVFEANTFQKDGRNYYFITMGFVSGETLSQLLTRKIWLPVPVALSIQRDLLSGLAFAHNQSPPIIHRDISPDNVLLSYEESGKPVALLSDFGLAQSVDQLASLPGAAGKHLYLAPECFWDAYLLASDVFSAGIVLYRMLTGAHPWEYRLPENPGNPEEMATAVLAARKAPPCRPSLFNADCSEYLEEVVLSAISEDLEKRFKNSSEFLAALDAMEAGPDATHRTRELHKGGQAGKPSAFDDKLLGFGGIAGMDELKSTLYHDVIAPLKEKELYEQYKISLPNGMVLYGPPGCGKTFIARKFAEEIGHNFVEVRPSDLASVYIHGTQKAIGELFKSAREKAPTILFIDELDAIAPRREGRLNHGYASEVNELLSQLADCHKYGVFVIAATNQPEMIDPAILRTGRFDKVIYVSPPDFGARLALFRLYLSGRPADPGIDYEEMARLTANYVSSDIKFMIDEASRLALRERARVSQSHLERVIQDTRPSISEAQIQKYEEFKKSRSFV